MKRFSMLSLSLLLCLSAFPGFAQDAVDEEGETAITVEAEPAQVEILKTEGPIEETEDEKKEEVIADDQTPEQDKFDAGEIAGSLGKKASSGAMKAVDFAIARYGNPSAFIVGREAGAQVLAVGYFKGNGKLISKNSDVDGLPVNWNIPSLGLGGEIVAGGSLILVYGPVTKENLYRNFTGVKASANALVGASFQMLKESKKITKKDGLTLIYIKLGLGLGSTLSINSMTFTEKDCLLGKSACDLFKKKSKAKKKDAKKEEEKKEEAPVEEEEL